MSRSAALLSAALLALTAASPAGQALTLLEERATEDGTQLRIHADRTQLDVRAVEGELALDGERLGPEPASIEAGGSSWRGFANVTTLPVQGSGQLLIAANGTGLLLAIETTPEPANASPSDPTWNRSSAEEAQDTSSPAEETAKADASATSPATESPSSQASAETDGEAPGRSARPARGSSDEAEPGHLLQDPVPVALILLASGAFLVERWTSHGSDRED